MRRREFLLGASTAVAYAGVAAGINTSGSAAASTRLASRGSFVTSACAPESPLAHPGAHPIGAVFCAPRYAQARQFAQELARNGAAIFSTQDDVVQLWRGPVAACLSRAPIRIAGLTLHSDLEVLRTAGAELGLRVMHEALHSTGCDGAVLHSLRSLDDLGLVEQGCATHEWPLALALALRRAEWTAAARETVTVQSHPPACVGIRGTLASWVIGR